MDFAIPPRPRDTAAADARLHPRHDHSAGRGLAADTARPHRCVPARAERDGRGEGLLAPHVSPEFGGLGLSHVGKAVVFEEAGYSLLGPLAMNIFAPDEGNMHLLEVVATPAQKERWLRPLASGAIRSCFCMTEPPPGAGSDPAALATTAGGTATTT